MLVFKYTYFKSGFEKLFQPSALRNLQLERDIPLAQSIFQTCFGAENRLFFEKGGVKAVDRQQIFEYAKQRYNTLPDYPWEDQNAVLRHRKNKKWYALIMEVDKKKLGLFEEGLVQVMNVKCDPMLIGSLRTREGFHPAYHMNKDKWISVRLDGSVSEDEIRNLIDGSYGLTAPDSKGLERK